MITAIKVILIICLPLGAFTVGAGLMSYLSDHEEVTQQVLVLPNAADRVLLNKRLHGYDSGAVARYWSALDAKALEAERCFLKLDLFFPLLYGSAFLLSLLIAWAAVDGPFSFYFLLAPVAITVLADWTENTVQLAQLRHYTEGKTIYSLCIQIASAATMCKLFTIWAMVIILAVLTVWLIAKAITSR